VIMNLIFAVILAAIAYRMGVEEMPAIVGSTSPGGAAWSDGIEPGSKIIQIGRGGKPYEHLRWSDIRTTAVLNSGHDVSLLVRKPNGQEQWYDVRPKKNPESKLPLIGIGLPHKPEIEIFPQAVSHLNPQASPALEDYDRVVEAAGQKVTGGADLMAIFAQQPQGPMPIKVERRERTKAGKAVEKPAKPPETIETTLQPKPMRELGLAMKMGPIVAVQAGSPAAKAGFQVEDMIVEIDGKPVGDPLSLSQRLTPEPGSAKSIEIVVERKDKQGKASRKTIEVVPEAPLQSPVQMPTNPTSIEPLGVAFQMTNEVAAVDEDGPADKAGLEAGDILTELQFVSDDQEREKALTRFAGPLIFRPIDLNSGKKSWTEVIYLLQTIYPDMKAKLTWKRGEKEMSAELLPRDSTSFFNDTRGVTLYIDMQPHSAATWSEAAFLGYREARDQLTQVVTILHRLITGRLSATNLSGPLGIIGVAGSFASQGIAPLLLFLTMLSANLAVLNFLPIPALDGGHMLFLSAEAIRGKPVDERLQIRLTIAGVICLLSLMVFATAMDIQRFSEMFQKWFG
jgi:regulator of sigma E protease